MISQQCATYISYGMARKLTTGSVVNALPYRTEPWLSEGSLTLSGPGYLMSLKFRGGAHVPPL